MNKLPFFLIVALALTACGDSPETTQNASQGTQDTIAQGALPPEEKPEIDVREIEIPIPKGTKLLASEYGDLDKDGIDELVVVYDLLDEPDDGDGNKRSIVVYSAGKDSWKAIDQSKSAVRGSSEGGMMGDPYDGIEIKKGVLIVYHNGGSRWKWSDTDKYRYQHGQFELIGYKGVYGTPCEYWQDVDFNLSTGKLNFKKEQDDCDEVSEEDRIAITSANETVVRKDIKLTLKNRHEKDIEIKLPKSGETVYL